MRELVEPRRLLFIMALPVAMAALAIERRDGDLPPGRTPAPVRVVSYNIRAGLGGLDGVASDLRATRADLIALQEVERGSPRSGRDQAAALARTLRMHHAFAGAFPTARGEQGVAVLSRYPIVSSRTVKLPRGSGRFPRVALVTRVVAPADTLVFVSTHLERPWEWPFAHTRARVAQIDSLLATLADERWIRIVAGDFNSLPFAPEDWTMRTRLRCAWSPWRDGWGASFPLRAIGWPFGSVPIDRVYHDGELSSMGTWVAPEGASDHRAVVVDLDWRTSAKEKGSAARITRPGGASLSRHSG